MPRVDRPGSRSRVYYPAAWRAAAGVLLVTGSLCQAAESVRVATFNVSLYGQQAGELLSRLAGGTDSQARHLAEIIQRVRPEVLLLNEIDYDPHGAVLKAFSDSYLAVPQNVLNLAEGPAEAIRYRHRYAAPSNTGVHSGHDLNRDGQVDDRPGSDVYAADCWGYGRYEGQYGMAILSNYPLDVAAIRTFRNFLWKDMPAPRLPDDPQTPAADDWYSRAALEGFPLSSKSHWDVPVIVGGRRIHLLASHPTPPVYDGAEDRNGRRNRDEIRFWADYVSSQYAGGASEGIAGTTAATHPKPYIYDDAGRRGYLSSHASFVILGDLNGDPLDGDGVEGIGRLLASPRLKQYAWPSSRGAAEQARLQGGANLRHRGDPAWDTCDPPDHPGPGNLRIDYVLPSSDLAVRASGVFWPEQSEPVFGLVGVHPFPSSDHRLVWVDLDL